MIIVVSDIQLGYNKCDKDLFYEFIDVKLRKLNNDDHLILLGDLFDFWRKNCVEVTLEYEKDRTVGDPVATNKEGIIAKKLYYLQKQTHFHYVIGNLLLYALLFSKTTFSKT
jgi:UDP-2,3-diacylglucosamine pyrophosphatase LpxH